MSRLKVFVPRDATACALGADAVAESIIEGARGRGLEIDLVRNGSRGAFWLEPMVEVETEIGRIAFGPVAPADLPGMFEAGFPGPADHALALGAVDRVVWLAGQRRLSFLRAGGIDAVSLGVCRSVGGF